MRPDPIDLTRVTVRAFRWLDDSRRTLAKHWDRLATPGKRDAEPPPDRRQPPEIW